MEIIDGRCRPPSKPVMIDLGRPPEAKFFAPRLCAVPLPPSAGPRSYNLFWQEFAEAGIAKGVFSWRGDTLASNPPTEVDLTDHVAEEVANSSGRLVGTICVDPLAAQHDPIKEIERGVKQYGFTAVGMDVMAGKPRMAFNDERLNPIYKKCSEMDLPIITAVGPLQGAVLEANHPRYVEEALKRFPDLKLVMSHGPYPFVAEFIALAMRQPNLYLMPDYQSFLPGAGLYLEAGNGVLSDQVLFGSAYPIIAMKDAVDLYAKFPFSDENRQKVMGGNMKRLLKLH